MKHPSRRLQLDAEFDQWLADNPDVYDKFRLLAVKLKAKGFNRWGQRAIWEVLRYELAITPPPTSRTTSSIIITPAAWPESS